MDPSQPRKKRRLRAPAETVREKAVRAQEQAVTPVTPTKKRRAGKVFGAPLRVLAWLGHKPPLRQIGHGLRWFFTTRIMRFIGRILGVNYLRESWRELRLVSWPSRRQSRQLTVAVIVFSVIFGGLIALVDIGLDKLFKQFLLK